MAALVLHRTPEPTPRPVLATLRDGRVEVWLVSDFDDVVAKADGDKVKPFRPPKIYHDSQGSFRWITLHPNGRGEKGVPVKIRESKTEPGTWHVVAGAGGKLNYARLSNIGSIEEQKERYYARQEQKKAAKVDADRADAERFDALSPDEQEAEQQAKRDLREKKKTAQEKLEVEQREAIANVAKLLDWPEDEWSFEATRARLQAAKAPKERIEQLERAHLKRMMTKVKQVQRETRKRLLVDHEARAAAGLGEVPLRSDNPDEIALHDLDPDKPGKGKGFASGTGELSDRSILKEIASKDVERLQQEEQAARDDYDPEQPATRGRLEQIRAEHTIASVCQEFAEKSDDEIAAAVAELEGERQDATLQLLDLRQRIEKQKGVVERTQDKDLKRLEKERLETMKAAVGGALEDRRAAQLKLDALAATQESGILAVKGERTKLSRQRQQEREQQLRAEGATDEDIENYRDRREAFLRAGEMYRAEIEARKLAGQIKAPEVDVKPIDDPKKAVELLRATKRIEQLAKAAEATDKAGSADDVEKLFGKGMYLDTSDIDRQVERDIRNDIAESSTRSFLSEVYAEDPTQAELLSLTEDQKREALQRHVGVGAFRALNTACLTILKEPALPRDVVDVLGTGGAAQLLAVAIHRGHDADELAAIREGLEEYHLQNHLEQSEAAVATARDLYEQVRELELGAAANPADLATLQEINAQRRAKLLEARQALGETLGELESFAQLAVALRSNPASQIDVTLGPIAADAAIRQCRALGLGRDDYSIDFDGTNRYLRVNQSGIETLLSGSRVDPAELKQDAEVDAIKRGERDEPDWIPKGLISWPKSAFRVDPDLGPAPLTRGLKPPSDWGDGSDIATDIHAHIGARIANGEAPGDILPDLLTHISTLPEDRRPAALDVVDKLTPEQVVKDERGRTVFAKVPARDDNGQIIYDAPDQPRMVTKVGEDGKPVPAMRRLHADAYRDNFRAVAEAYMAKNYPDRKVAAFHAQGLNLEGDAGETTRKALYAALAADPRAAAGFKAPGELSSTDRRSLRSYFDSHVAPAARGDEIDLDAEREKLRTLGDAPEEFSTDMFGTKTRSQEHAAWSEKRAAIVERINRGTLGWNQYVRQMGGVDRAYAALQDRLKGDLLERFHTSHAGMAGEPLRAGVMAIREAERHGAFVDPKRREEIRAKMEEIRQSLQQRKTKGQAGGGQFTGLLGQVTAVMQAEEKARQNQVSLFGGGGGGTGDTGVKTPRTKAEAHERFALGERVEAQVGQLLRERAAENLSQRPDVQSKLFPGFSMSDAYVKQQRAVKMFATAKRINAALGTGCVAGETLLYDPVTRRSRTFVEAWIDGGANTVLAWDASQSRFVVAEATHVFVKSIENMFEVKLESGLSVTVTGAHRFLTPEGWRRLDAIPVGARLAVAGDAAGAPLSTEKARDSRARCSTDHCRRGEPLLLAEAACQAHVPSPSGVQTHIHPCLLPDAHVPEPSRIHTGSSARRSTLRSCFPDETPLATQGCEDACGSDAPSRANTQAGPQSRRSTFLQHTALRVDAGLSDERHALTDLELPREVAPESRVPPSADRRCAGGTQNDVRSPQQEHSPQRAGEARAHPEERVDSAYREVFHFDVVTAISLVGPRLVFDIHVPRFENYVANRIVHHNSGKTPISIGAFTHVASDPKSGVKRGIWVVPSTLQGQFHGEMAQFVEPGKFNWHSKPGASHEERMAAHRDPDTHMVVMTHQGLRDDMAKLVGEHLGAKNEGELREKFMGLDRQQRAKLVGEVMGKHGMDYQAAFVDEGHILLDRDGKPDSLLSQMIQAITDNTSHFMSMSADPAKNDVSEIRSQLDKIYTDGRYGDSREWHKRYGLNTTASRDALKLEVGRRMIMGHIQPDVEARKRQESVPLSAAQSASYKRVLEVYDKARAARSAGKIDVEAIRELAPKEFAGAPAEKHEEIARRLAPSIGIIKEAALHRAVNLAKPESNAKLQKLRELLKTHPTKEKPVVVFAHNLEAVDAIEKQLAADGHRVTALTGAHSGEEKDRRRRAFNPAKGETPTADVIVMSDAGATGLNLQRGQTLIQYDTPMTAMVHQQRNGRIHRLGQTRDVDLIDLVTDTPFEGRARERMARKMDLRDVFTDPGDAVDDTGLAGFISRARARQRRNDETPPLAA